MGTCYSKSGHEIDPAMVENRPREKGSSKNGHVKSKKKNPLLTIDSIPIHKDVSDTVFTEDSHVGNALDIENCINKSQQTSLDHLAAKDPSKFIDTQEDLSVTCDDSEQDVDRDVSAESGLVVENQCVSGDGQVVASDSGIVVESCASLGCETITQSTATADSATKDAYSESFELIVDEVKEESHSETISSHLKSVSEKTFQTKEKVQSQIISSLKQSSEIICQNGHSSKAFCNGECLDSFISSNYFSHGNLDRPVMKSSLKKTGPRSRRKKGLSWKSSDSLDWLDSMTTTLDRTKSVCSSIFGDDISLLNAPLAAFDSVDFAIGDSYDFSKQFGPKLRKTAVPVEYISDTMQLKFDFSGLEGENRRSITSLDRLSESHKNMDSTTDLDKIKLVLRQSSVSSSEQRFYADQVDTSYELPSLMQQPEIMTTTMNGREVVVIDADLFTQITDEIQFLKMKLMELKDDIQETDAMETTVRAGRSTPLSSLSSIS